MAANLSSAAIAATLLTRPPPKDSLSAFVLEGDAVYYTYSAYARGVDAI